MRKLLLLAMLCPLLTMCQPLAIKGKIINEASEPVAGATVTLKRTGASTISNEVGEFSFPASFTTDTFIISAVGYITTDEYNNERGLITVILRRKISVLDEAVIIAYGTTTRRLSTGNVAVVTAATIASQPVMNPLAALQGRVPGLIITQSSGVAGSAYNIQLRGRTSLDLSLTRNDPLIVIDGVPFEAGNTPSNLLGAAFNNPYAISGASATGLSPLNAVNPLDIESISVLKDADATAIYGSRGANGVLLITTKRGKAGKTSFTASLSSGFSKVARPASFLNTSQYIAMRREAFKVDSLQPTAANAPDLLLWDTTRYTNFGRLLTGGTAHTTDAQVGLSGGGATTRFTLGGGYHREGAVFPGNFPAERASAQFSLVHSPLGGKWEARLSLLYASATNRLPVTDLSKYLALPPNLSLYAPGGGLAWSEGGTLYSALGFVNPLADLLRTYRADGKTLTAGFVVSYTFFRGAVLRLNSGYNSFSSAEISITPKAALAPQNTTLASSQFGNSTRTSWLLEPQVDYSATLGKGQLKLLAGATFQQKNYASFSINATGYTTDLLLGALGAAGAVTATNGSEQYNYAAAFGRLTYNYAQKYLFNASLRRDGSSRFGPERRFATFGSVGAGWVFSAERAMQKAVPALSFGKLRVTYGVTGNDQVGDYRFLDLWTSTINPYGGIPGLRPVALFNPDYEWEKNTKWELGLDLGFWADRLGLNLAAFRNRSSNQLITYRLPSQTGFTSVVKNLPALVQNTGLEIVLEGTPLKSASATWKLAVNITLPSNRLVSFPGLAASSYNGTYAEGKSLTVLNKLKYLGVDPATGLYSYEDANKDGQITTPADLQVLGDLDPDYYGGISNTVQWRGWDLNLFFQFTKQQGPNFLAAIYNTPPGFLSNQPSLVLEQWQAPGNMSPVQRFAATAASPAFGASYNLSASNGIYSDASFWRLKTLAVSYNLPASLITKWKAETVKIYVQAQNLFTFTSYRGADPETGNLFQLPPLRTITAGIRFIF